MKYIVVFFSVCLLLTACSKKTKPTNAVTTTPVNPPVVKVLPAPMIVVDGNGRIITTKSKLPDSIGRKVDYSKIERAFTPNQKTNLIYRYKIVPPKVLYVPDVYVQKSLKGDYCVYKQKFWYWKKADGLFYLDETYYK